MLEQQRIIEIRIKSVRPENPNLRLHRVIPMVQLRSQVFSQMKQKSLTVAELQSRIIVKYDEKMPGKCVTRALRGDALKIILLPLDNRLKPCYNLTNEY